MESFLDTTSYKTLVRADLNLLNSYRLFYNGSETEKKIFKEDVNKTLAEYALVYNQLNTNEAIVSNCSTFKGYILDTVKYLRTTDDFTLNQLSNMLFVGKIKKSTINKPITNVDRISLNTGNMLDEYKTYQNYNIDKKKEPEFVKLMDDIFSTLAYYLKIEENDKMLFKEINEAVDAKEHFNEGLLYDIYVGYNNLNLIENYNPNLPVNIIPSKGEVITLEDLIRIMDIEHPGYNINKVIDYLREKYIIYSYDKKLMKQYEVYKSLTKSKQLDEEENIRTK